MVVETFGEANAFLAIPLAEPDVKGVPGFIAEVVGVNHYHKEGLVTEKETDNAWWMVSDEGAYMGGTEMGPAPLMYWLAGLEASLTAGIVSAINERGESCSRAEVSLRQDYGISGSFSKGDAMGVGGPVTIEYSVESSLPVDELEPMVDAIVQANGELNLCRNQIGSLFSLYSNGRHSVLPEIPQAPPKSEKDPFRRHAERPARSNELTEKLLVKREPGNLEPRTPLGQENDGRTWFSLTSTGAYNFGKSVVESVTELSGSHSPRWRIVSDPAGRVAPSPGAVISIGIAFCFHTQLARFAKVRKMEIENPRLLQLSEWSDGQPLVETHVFVNGHQGEEAASSLVTTSMNTCYAHKSLASQVLVLAVRASQ